MNYSNIEKKVKKMFEANASGHDWWHIARVVHNAELIQKEEGGDLEIKKLTHVDAVVRAYLDTNWIDSARVFLETEGSPEALCALVPMEIRRDTVKTKEHLNIVQSRADTLLTKDPDDREGKEMNGFCEFYRGLLKISMRPGSFYELTASEKLQLEDIANSEMAIASNAQAILDFVEERPHEYFLEGPTTSKMMQFSEEENVNEKQKQLAFKVHPNPSTGNIILTVEEGVQLSDEARYEVTDLAGRKIATIKVMPNTTTYTFEISTNGIYIVTLRDGNEIKDVQRVILSNN